MIRLDVGRDDKEVLVSDEDYAMLSEYSWSVNYQNVVSAYVDGKMIPLHRLIMEASEGEEVDHINMNRLDNRRENLRICTRAQNQANIGLTRANTSGYKGVWVDRRRKRPYQACIKFNKKTTHIGDFDDPEEAAMAYDAAAIQLWGEHARLNFKVAGFRSIVELDEQA